MDIYEAYVQKTFEVNDKMFHEIVSPGIHLDVIITVDTGRKLLQINYDGCRSGI